MYSVFVVGKPLSWELGIQRQNIAALEELPSYWGAAGSNGTHTASAHIRIISQREDPSNSIKFSYQEIPSFSEDDAKKIELSFLQVLLIEVTAFLLQAALLLVLYILLSRQIANCSHMVKAASTLAQEMKKPKNNPESPASEKTRCKRSAPGSQSYRDDSHNGSDSSSESSDSSERYPSTSTSKAAKDVNYSTLVFPAADCRRTLSPKNYENTKAAGDYVNVDPKKCKNTNWNFNCSSSEPVEYTEVAM
ncbi:regulator of hemoglobinization and erythroid cell expansion protein [Gracilinanus agilis]|uniref:regulator of hemoglobinization and erythroid cell expansion protein n=1 Tax=Gracilinanus agilis TaxID=191870 RepID=UPI001CFC9C68|nr:regulator of hemoglobinization and erythroid cell expansion protein [Gracilinanus agilis]